VPRGYQRHSAILGDPWHRCQRCDCECRVSELNWQNGLLLCKKCWDNPQAWARDTQIQDALTDSPEEAQVAEKLRGSTNEPEPPIP
jgi:hypothetical protein